jgi:hypothetical protein
MAWNNEEWIDPEELGSLLKLMPTSSGLMDLELSIKIDGSFIQGESKSKHGGSDVLALFGYYFKSQLLHSTGNLHCASFWIIRDVDAATASLTSAMVASSGKKNAKLMDVELRAFKSGGPKVLGEVVRPTLCFKMERTLIGFQAFHTNSPSGIPSEVVGFSFARMTIETTPQLESGLMGATRTCVLTQQ